MLATLSNLKLSSYSSNTAGHCDEVVAQTEPLLQQVRQLILEPEKCVRQNDIFQIVFANLLHMNKSFRESLYK